ncbi:MAG TPA: kelch repeat-containing protein [Casimicrobiaceae bacterium]|nr:kelch repeat-containing protein [Casimicrobiaceae bacterium]
MNVVRSVSWLAGIFAIAAAFAANAQDPLCDKNHYILGDGIPSCWVLTGSLDVPLAGHTATRLQDGRVLVVGGDSAELYDPATRAWSATSGPIVAQDSYHTATLLPSGEVLVAGGLQLGGPADTAELYDPVTETWRFTPLSPPLPLGLQTATLLTNGQVLFAGGIWGENRAELYDPATGTWSVTGNLGHNRFGHTATLLGDGRVLIAGGFDDDIFASAYTIASSELYDPMTGSWTSTGDLKTAVGGQTAVLLPSGKVLLAGGSVFDPVQPGPESVLAESQLYDPATGEWSLTGSLQKARFLHTATLLPTGQVLVVGGATYSGTALASAEVYDEAIGTWSEAASLNVARSGHTATLLATGAVLVAGGFDGSQALATAELSAPSASWRVTGSLNVPRAGGPVTLLPSGKVLAVSEGSAELYDPATGTWTLTASPNVVRYGAYQTATLLQNGQVLVAGGANIGAGADTAELYDPATETWSFTPLSPPLRLGSHTATLLTDGKVLFAGGTWLGNRAELYDPATGVWTITGDLNQFHEYGQTATLLRDGRVLVAGGFDGDSVLPIASSELYDPTTGSWASTGDLKTAVGFHTSVLLPSGKVLLAGGTILDPGVLVPGNAASQIYDPATGQWSLTGSLQQPRFFHAATLLATGQAIVVGGAVHSEATPLASVEQYDEPGGSWSSVASLNVARALHTATLLLTGDVLVAGGFDGTEALKASELYTTGSPPTTISPGFTGAWYDPAQSGHGLIIEVQPGNRFYASWFAFNPAGTEQAWFTGVGSYGGNTATIASVLMPTGGRWIPNFDPSQILLNPWGTLTFTFTDCNHGRVDFSSGIAGYGSGSMNLTRLTQPAGLARP